MKFTFFTKQCNVLIIVMERLLVLWLKDQNQQCIPVRFMIILEKAKRLFEPLKSEKGVKVKSLWPVGVGLCGLCLFGKCMSSTYIAKYEKAASSHKVRKERLSLFLGPNAAGDFILRPLLVCQAENLRTFKCIWKGQLPVI